jgi:2-polyprenyl-3-methyl-5-hydroxy-6-metoxy-1,4-benzoquinol methylase
VGRAAGIQAIVLPHPDADITLKPLPSGKRRVQVRMHDPAAHIWRESFETSLPPELVGRYLEAHGPAGLCYVLDRIEGDGLRQTLLFSILPFVAEEQFTGKRLLDFGCGSGTSTVHLARMFPQSEIVGLELLPELLEPAQGLMEHMGFEHVRFVQAKAEDSLPDDLGSFDFVMLNAVYEHLLPNERRLLLPQLWASLRRGGVLFLNMTPFRWYPYEHHTTELWFVNYLPDWLALRYVRFFGGRKRRYLDREAEWEGLLRGGIRGGSERQVMRLLAATSNDSPIALRPSLWGFSDATDIWYAQSIARGPRRFKPPMRIAYKAIGRLVGSPFAPDVTMALRKK